ncbi:MAG: hypothetical protein JSR15_09815 [Proteobacteria bacterium]|nr:hypothetical protein [Pseudomonadota bacterium]
MPTVSIHFKELIQDSQNYGSDDEHMVSRVFFDLQVGDKRYPRAHANIRQEVGAGVSDPIEVSPPAGYAGPFDLGKFQAEVESYFRSVVGKSRSRIRDCRYRKDVTVSFEIVA